MLKSLNEKKVPVEKVIEPRTIVKCKCGIELFRKDIVQDNLSGVKYRCPKCFEVLK